MASDTKTPTTIQPDALAYAKKRGVAEYLPAVLEMTQRVFPKARRIEVVVEDDVSIPDWHYLIVMVFAAEDNWTGNQYFEAGKRWREELFTICPGSVAGEFCFSLENLNA